MPLAPAGTVLDGDSVSSFNQRLMRPEAGSASQMDEAFESATKNIPFQAGANTLDARPLSPALLAPTFSLLSRSITRHPSTEELKARGGAPPPGAPRRR